MLQVVASVTGKFCVSRDGSRLVVSDQIPTNPGRAFIGNKPINTDRYLNVCGVILARWAEDFHCVEQWWDGELVRGFDC